MMAAKDNNLCWQCSEHCIYFPEILNVIDQLLKEDTLATKQSIESKLREVDDGYNEDRCKRLTDILTFATEQGYIRKEHRGKKRKVSTIYFMINRRISGRTCEICNAEIEPFSASNFKVGRNYVDKMTFENLAREVAELKDFVAKGWRHTDNDEVDELREENKILKKEIASKEQYIHMLLEKICHINSAPEKNKQSFDDIDNQYVTVRKKSTKNNKQHDNIISPIKKNKVSFIDNDIQLENRFESLPTFDENLTDSTDSDDSQIIDYGKSKPNKDVSVRKRPLYFNTRPENDNLTIPKKESLKKVPGANTYSETIKEGKKIYIFGDSVIQRLR